MCLDMSVARTYKIFMTYSLPYCFATVSVGGQRLAVDHLIQSQHIWHIFTIDLVSQTTFNLLSSCCLLATSGDAQVFFFPPTAYSYIVTKSFFSIIARGQVGRPALLRSAEAHDTWPCYSSTDGLIKLKESSLQERGGGCMYVCILPCRAWRNELVAAVLRLIPSFTSRPKYFH